MKNASRNYNRGKWMKRFRFSANTCVSPQFTQTSTIVSISPTWSSGHYSLFRTLWSHMIRPHDDVVLFLIHYLGLISLAYTHTLDVSENFLRKNRISGDTCWSSSMTIFSWDISLSDSCLYTKRLIFISFQSHAFIFLNVSVKIWVWKYRSFIL